jgi:O-antigen/teichoic acid export membrane protein
MTSIEETHPLEYAAAAEPPPLASRDARTLIFVTVGRMALVGLWFLGGLLLARHLAPAQFGLYTLCVYTVRIVTGCLGDPLDRAVMREAPLYFATDRARALAIFRAAFWMRVAIGAASIFFAAALPAAASWLIFGKTDYGLLALLTAFGVLTDLLLRSAFGYFQVAGRFSSFMTVDAVWQVGRLAAVVVLIALGALTLQRAVSVYVAAPLVAFLIGAIMLPRDILTPTAPSRAHLSDIFHYSKWLAFAAAFAAVYERLDVVLVGRFRGEHDLGVYAGAMFLATIPDFVNSAVQTVLTPAYASGSFGALNRAYLKYAVPLGGVALLVALTCGGWIIEAFLSQKYVEAIPAFKILLIGTIVNVVFTPLPSALLAFVAPRVVALVTLLGLAFVAVGGTIAIPRYGIIGAASLILATRVVIGLIVNVLVLRLLRPIASG